jgi:hypothetical protein
MIRSGQGMPKTAVTHATLGRQTPPANRLKSGTGMGFRPALPSLHPVSSAFRNLTWLVFRVSPGHEGIPRQDVPQGQLGSLRDTNPGS